MSKLFLTQNIKARIVSGFYIEARIIDIVKENGIIVYWCKSTENKGTISEGERFIAHRNDLTDNEQQYHIKQMVNKHRILHFEPF